MTARRGKTGATGEMTTGKAGVASEKRTGGTCAALKPVRKIHENPWFALMKRGGYYTVEYHNPLVVVLPVVKGRGVVMLVARRPVIGGRALELPGGAADPGESPRRAAMRELAEESGIHITEASRFTRRPPVFWSSTRSPAPVLVYEVAVKPREYAGRGPHDDEVESVRLVPEREIKSMAASGKIKVGVTLAVLFGYFCRKKSGG